MQKIISPLITGLVLLHLASSASGQASNLALGQAKARLACGTGTVVSSQFLPNGSLQVTCSQNVSSSSTAALGTGLVTPVTGALLAVTAIALVASGGSSENETTTNTNDQ